MEANEITNVEIEIPQIAIQNIFGFASVVIRNDIYLSGIIIYKKIDGGYDIRYPKSNHKTCQICLQKNPINKFDLYKPINKTTGTVIKEAIIQKINEIEKINK